MKESNTFNKWRSINWHKKIEKNIIRNYKQRIHTLQKIVLTNINNI